MKSCAFSPPVIASGKSRLTRASKQQAKFRAAPFRTSPGRANRANENRRPVGRRLLFGSAKRPVLADRRGVLQAALGPQLVEAALDLERRSHADVAVEAFAVVADLLHDI